MKSFLSWFNKSKSWYAVSCVLVRELEDSQPTYQHTIHKITAISEEVAILIAQEKAIEQCYGYKVVDTVAIQL